MADLISREAAIEICKSVVPNTNPDFYNLRSKAGYGSWMHSNGEVCAITNIETKIEALPAVDAIPMEWLRDKMRGYASSLKSTETAALVMVMQMWQKEQEKQGIEPKEG